MNNFSNFDGNISPNNLRPAPQAAQAQQFNGTNGAQQWPNVGAQSDMNVLWDYIVKLSEMHEQIRQQTQNVASGMQQIEAMRTGGSPSTAANLVNGATTNGLPAGPSENAEIARLQSEIASSHSRLEAQETHIHSLQNINADYENALSYTLDKLRPFTQQHQQALLSQKAHYLRLLEEERQANLELRMEQSRWQENAARVKDNLVEALKLQSESEVRFVKKIAQLKTDNRSLRRLCGVPLLEESDTDGDDDEAREEGAVQAGSKASPT